MTTCRDSRDAKCDTDPEACEETYDSPVRAGVTLAAGQMPGMRSANYLDGDVQLPAALLLRWEVTGVQRAGHLQ